MENCATLFLGGERRELTDFEAEPVAVQRKELPLQQKDWSGSGNGSPELNRDDL